MEQKNQDSCSHIVTPLKSPDEYNESDKIIFRVSRIFPFLYTISIWDIYYNIILTRIYETNEIFKDFFSYIIGNYIKLSIFGFDEGVRHQICSCFNVPK